MRFRTPQVMAGSVTESHTADDRGIAIASGVVRGQAVVDCPAPTTRAPWRTSIAPRVPPQGCAERPTLYEFSVVRRASTSERSSASERVRTSTKSVMKRIELIGEAEKHGDGSCPIAPAIRAGDGPGALHPPRAEGRHSN